jgi:SnoaL-like protein
VDELAQLAARVRSIEDELAVRRVILSYGPAADAGMSERGASIWLDDGTYDWGATAPLEGRTAIEAMLRGDAHRNLIGDGAAHFSGSPLVEIDGDRATALSYSMVLRREAETGRFFVWRLSAAHWELLRHGDSWRVQRRTHRLLDDTGAGRALFGEVLHEHFGGREETR